MFVKKYLVIMALFVCGFGVVGTVGATEETYSTHYYRQLVYNHVSPYIPIRGIYEITPETAQKAPHYVFKMDAANRIVEIINHNPEAWKQHVLTHIKVYRVLIKYVGNQEIRTFFDQTNQQKFSYDENGFLIR